MHVSEVVVCHAAKSRLVCGRQRLLLRVASSSSCCWAEFCCGLESESNECSWGEARTCVGVWFGQILRSGKLQARLTWLDNLCKDPIECLCVVFECLCVVFFVVLQAHCWSHL